MQIWINKKLAVLKENTSFEYVSENRLFSGADDYSMEISLPLEGCKENLEIFGQINRKGMDINDITFDCEIRDGDFYKSGAIAITEISESEVKVQFLEGRSAQNYNSSFDDVFINELDLGYMDYIEPTNIEPIDAMDPTNFDFKAVCLPWVNGGGSNDIIHNEMVRDETKQGNQYKWGDDVQGLSWQPYLLFIAKKICEAIGYSYDFEDWENNDALKYFIICNSLPDAWDIYSFARILPHWSVAEFFSKLEDFLGGEFDFDYKQKSISFKLSMDVERLLEPVKLDNIVDEFTVDVEVNEEEEKCNYVEERAFMYEEQDFSMWKFYDCKWFIDTRYWPDGAFKPSVLEFETFDDFIKLIKSRFWGNYNGLEGLWWTGYNERGWHMPDGVYFIKERNIFYIFRWFDRISLGVNPWGYDMWRFLLRLQPINYFGQFNVKKNSEKEDNKVELAFVPVAIDYTDIEHGDCMFLYPSTYSEELPEAEDWDPFEPRDNDFIPVLGPSKMIEAGEKDDLAEYYSNIFIGYWDGKKRYFEGSQNNLLLPHPYVYNVNLDWNLNVSISNFSMRLNDGTIKSRYRGLKLITSRKYNYKFLADKVPNPRAIFHIRGKRFLCESLTMNFSVEGRSELIKGVFWEIDE